MATAPKLVQMNNQSVPQEAAHDEAATKKEQILSIFRDGTSDIIQIAYLTSARPSYVAQVLQSEGLISGYFDLYTSTNRDSNAYASFFHGILSFRSPEAARESVRRIDKLYRYFDKLGDRAGQHQAMVVALTGKNRARWSGKEQESKIFHDWLAQH